MRTTEPARDARPAGAGLRGRPQAEAADQRSTGAHDRPRSGSDDPPVPGPDNLPGSAVAQSGASVAAVSRQPFQVHLENFEGPFDLLLALISKHKLDVTEVALSRVTDEFIAFIRSAGAAWDLGHATEFLVVAATLLDLKAARLLPAAEVDDEEDLALLEARDLLFARLLQYRAFKEAAAHLAALDRAQSRRHPRAVTLDPWLAAAQPEVSLGLDPGQFAQIAATALVPKVAPVVPVDHVHVSRVSVREHAALIQSRLARSGRATFRALIADCATTLEVVARFLALLELYRDGAVAFDQVAAFGELHVRWAGGDRSGPVVVVDEYDDEKGTS